MSKILTILYLLILLLPSCVQRYATFSFQNIGLRIKIPDNYVSQTISPKITFPDSSGNTITDTAQFQTLEEDLMKLILFVSSSDHKNTASFNIVKETAKTGNLESYYNFSKKMEQLIALQQMTTYDTASSVLTADNIQVHKFIAFSEKANHVQYSGIYLAKVKGYFLVIKTDYSDKQFSEEIEKAMLTSKID